MWPLSICANPARLVSGLWKAIVVNATDIDTGDVARLTVSSIGTPTLGFISFDVANKLASYTADGVRDSRGSTDTFSYTVGDTKGGTVTGTVTVNVTGDSSVTSTRVGTNNADTLTATAANQRLDGAAANDILNGFKSGPDRLFGGAGDDTIKVTAGGNTIYGGSGADTIQLNGKGGNTVLLDRTGRIDQVSGFVRATDTLDISAILAGTAWKETDAINQSVKFTVSGRNTLVQVNPTGAAGGSWSTVAQLNGIANADFAAYKISVGNNLLA